jgi:ATP-dependent RNA helicase DDX18/HAS1
MLDSTAIWDLQGEETLQKRCDYRSCGSTSKTSKSCALVLTLTWYTGNSIAPVQAFPAWQVQTHLQSPRTGSVSSRRHWKPHNDETKPFRSFDTDDDFDTPFQQITRPARNNKSIQNTESRTSETLASKTSSPATSHFFSQKSLQDSSFRLDPSTDTFERLCRRAGIQRPSKIQSMAWPVLLKEPPSTAVMIAEQTGSGKTLAYLVPLLQRIIQTPRPPVNRTIATTAATPRLLILAPTAELADQIRNVCLSLSDSDDHGTSSTHQKSLFSTTVLTASGKHTTNIRDQIRMLQQRKAVDVLISTPGRIATILRTKHASERVLNLQHLQMVVLDEVDVLLLDETFGPQLQTIGEATTPTDSSKVANNATTQFVFVTATLPDSVIEQVESQFPGTTMIKGPGLHRVAPTVRERLIDVSVPSALNRDEAACFDAKTRALLEALRQNRCKRTLVFCNTVATCRQVENLLYRQDRKNQIYTVRAYHNAMTAQARNENLEFFSKAGANVQDISASRTQSTRSTSVDATSFILVCTDRAARGVDFAAAAVDHVVIFDFPVDPAEYVRRVGRTARAGRDGASTVLAYGWQLPIARSVMGQQQVNDGTGKNGPSFSDDLDTNERGEYRGGVKGRRASTAQQGKNGALKSRDSIIGGNIASGKLWNEKDSP